MLTNVSPLMNAEGVPVVSGAPTPVVAPAAAPVVAPAPVVVPAPGEEFKGMSVEQFTARLSKERELGTKSFLKSLGFDNAESAQGFLAEARKVADANKTEQQRMAERLAAIEPTAKKAEGMEATIKKYLASEEAAVPEQQRSQIPYADDPAKRLEWIAANKMPGGFLAQPQPAAPAAIAPAVSRLPNPANTIAPPGPAAPSPAGTLSVKQQYLDMKKTAPLAAATFYRTNRTAIEADQS